MHYLYPLLIYTGLAGVLLLLVLEMFDRFHALRKPTAAASLTLVTFLWLALPQEGRWLFSVWSPSPMLGGGLLIDMAPPIWRLGLALGLAFSGMAWVAAIETQSSLSLSGIIALSVLLVTWLALTSGSLLTTLVAWAIFDLLWGAAALMSGGEGERVTFAWTAHGLASLLLWAVTLLLGREGSSMLWWLLWPTRATYSLLLVAAVLRVGLYPFHVVFPRRMHARGPLALVSCLGPVLGMGLLYRLLSLPHLPELPHWLLSLGTLSLLWGGLRAWESKGTSAMLWSSYALLGGMVAGAGATGAAQALLVALAAWVGGWVLLVLARGYDARAPFWSLPGALALLFLLGVPPSPLGGLFRAALVTLSWGWRLLFVAGGALAIAAFLASWGHAAVGAVTPPWNWQRSGLAVGLVLPLVGLLSTATVQQALPFTWGGLALWLGMLFLAAALLLWGRGSRVWLHEKGVALGDFLDLEWLLGVLWRGLEHLLGLVRIVADVVEGAGALLWSLLILLLVLLMVVNQ